MKIFKLSYIFKESQPELENGSHDSSNDSSLISECPSTDCYDYNGETQHQSSFSFRNNAKSILKMSQKGQEANYGYSSSSNANCQSAYFPDSSSDYPTANGTGSYSELITLPPFNGPIPETYDWNYTCIYSNLGCAYGGYDSSYYYPTANGAGSFSEVITLPPFSLSFPETYDSDYSGNYSSDYNDPFSWASNGEAVNYDFPIMGGKSMRLGKEKRALAPFYDNQIAPSSDYSSKYNTYPRCTDIPESSTSIGAPIDYGGSKKL